MFELESQAARRDLQQEFEDLPVDSDDMTQSFESITWEEEDTASFHSPDDSFETKIPRTSTPQPHSVSLDVHMEQHAATVPPVSRSCTGKKHKQERDAPSTPTKKRKLGIKFAAERPGNFDFDVQDTATQTSPLPLGTLQPLVAKVSPSHSCNGGQEPHVSDPDTSFEVRVTVSVKPQQTKSDDSSGSKFTAVASAPSTPGPPKPDPSLVTLSTESNALHTRSESKANKGGTTRRKKKTERTKDAKNDSRQKKIKWKECVEEEEPLFVQGKTQQERGECVP